MTETLNLYERETIITFNEEEQSAIIFTYNRTWQRHIENKLGIQPIKVLECNGREYVIDKKRIPMPRAPRRLSPEVKARLAERGKKSLEDARKKRVLSSTDNKTMLNQVTLPSNKGNHITSRKSEAVKSVI